MRQAKLDTSTTEPATGGLRFALLPLLLLLVTACANQPKAGPGVPPPLVDRSHETDYRLDEVETKLQSAAEYAHEGQRAIADAILDTARKMLPADAVREREYLDVVKANIWSREGETRDLAKAGGLLDAVADSAAKRKDGRLAADVFEARVQIDLAEDRPADAQQHADAALRELAGIGAYAEQAWTARNLSFQFLDADDAETARAFASRAWQTATRLADDELLLQIGIDVARLLLIAGGDAEFHFKEAYEAAHRLLDDGYGWRNIVIAAAVDAYFNRDEMQHCVTWGDRLRDRDRGLLPGLRASQLWAGDYINVMAQYALAREQVAPKGPRATEAAELAVREIENLPEPEQADWNDLLEKLRSGLLQQPRGK